MNASLVISVVMNSPGLCIIICCYTQVRGGGGLVAGAEIDK